MEPLSKEQQEYEKLKSQFEEEDIHIELVMPEIGEMDLINLDAIYKDVKITHKPSGTEVICDRFDSQIKNGIQAFKDLITRLDQDNRA